MPVTDAVDFSMPFMPGHLTPLYHTPVYASLTDEQRLRYNQINALYFNEQTMFFERSLAHNVLGFFLEQPLPAGLKEGLHRFITEEETHSAMFLDLNRQCAPAIYNEHDFYFIRLPVIGTALLDMLSKHPDWFPFLLWLMHMQEECALFFGKVFLKWGDEIEPHFVEAQRRHLADEIGHVRWDQELLGHVWPGTNGMLRRFNAGFLKWMMREYFTTPKRSARRVVAALADEFPELKPQQGEICRQLAALGNDPAYLYSLYSMENVPDTFRRFASWREFDSLADVMPGYRRTEVLP
jgi:hypothetical protein